jgi:hypothetical protein
MLGAFVNHVYEFNVLVHPITMVTVSRCHLKELSQHPHLVPSHGYNRVVAVSSIGGDALREGLLVHSITIS